MSENQTLSPSEHRIIGLFRSNPNYNRMVIEILALYSEMINKDNPKP